MEKEAQIYIIGAGVAGLVAAYELELAGYNPIILEATDAVGGRVKTDLKDGFMLDRGFQVLLTEYPEAKRYLDYSQLNLKLFAPGSIILKPGNMYAIHDPIRNPLKLLSMAFSNIGNFMDKVKIFKLTNSLKKTTVEELFAEPSLRTIDFLKTYGFSEKIIQNFFKPFFKGIFLEEQLETSSRMFKFVFKMFSEGNAAIPEHGMQQIPLQLHKKLLRTEVRFNTPVKAVDGLKISLENGSQLDADHIIVATQPDHLFPQIAGQFESARSVVNVYFSLAKSFIAQPMIAIVPEETFLINNLVFLTDVSKAYATEDRALLSVSIVKPVAVNEKLPQLLAIELSALTGISSEFFEHVATYDVSYALPVVSDMRYDVPATNSKLYDNVYLAGDYLLNGSINAAMTSGRKAAEALILSQQQVY